MRFNDVLRGKLIVISLFGGAPVSTLTNITKHARVLHPNQFFFISILANYEIDEKLIQRKSVLCDDVD